MVERSVELTAEVEILGALLIDPGLAGPILAEVGEEDFLDPTYRTVFRAIRQLWLQGKPTDPVMVRSVLGREYNDLLVQCLELTVTTSNWKAHAALLREQAKLAKLREWAGQLATAPDLETAQQPLEQINGLFCQRQDRRIVSVAQGYQDFMERQRHGRQYIAWGFPKLDTRLYADAGDFIVLGGRPSAGKTMLALGMADHVSRSRRVGFFSLETSDAKLFDRYFAAQGNIDFARIKQHRLSPLDKEQLERQRESLWARKLEVVQASGMAVTDILALSLARRYQVIFVDYIQLIASRGGNRTEEVSRVSMDLHTMAQSHGITVVGLAQLSRQNQGERPRLTDLRESGQIEQDADAVMALYLANPEEPGGDRKLELLKNKEGQLGRFTIHFDGAHQRFCEAGATPVKEEPYPQQELTETNEEVPFTI